MKSVSAPGEKACWRIYGIILSLRKKGKCVIGPMEAGEESREQKNHVIRELRRKSLIQDSKEFAKRCYSSSLQLAIWIINTQLFSFSNTCAFSEISIYICMYIYIALEPY